MRTRLIALTVASAAALGSVSSVPVSAAPPTPLVVGAEVAITAARPANAQGESAVAFHNGVFFVVWQESSPTGRAQVYGARVKPDGTVLDPNGILLSTRPDDDNVHPRVAGGGGVFLVVWQIDIEGTYSDLGAALVGTGGVVKKQWGLSFVDNGQYSPDVAWNGQLFLATWQDEPDPGDEDVYGARVLASGLTLDGCSSDSCPNGDDPGLAIALGAGNQLAPVVTAANGLFLVGWTGDTDPARTTVRHTAVALNGFSLDQTGADITAGPGAQSLPAVAGNGGTVLWAWPDRKAGGSSNVRATLQKPGNESNYVADVTPPGGIAVSAAKGDQTAPAATKRNSHFVVAWSDMRNGNLDVFAARVGIAGAVLDTNGVAIATGAAAQQAPALASSGAKVLVAYTSGDRVALRIIG